MEMFIENIMSPDFYMDLWDAYGKAISIFFATILVVKLIKVYLIKRLSKLADKTTTDFDNFMVLIMKKVGWPFYIVVALYFGAKAIEGLPERAIATITYTTAIVVTFYILKLLGIIVDYAIHKLAQRNGNESLASMKAFSFLAKFALWSFVLVAVLSNFGYDLTSIITGLGIGGIAVGLALQNVLGDFFSGITILFDKPFEIGDLIRIGDQVGTIKSIGIKTSRITLLDGQELVITNKDLTESRVENYKKLSRRRELFTLGVTYDTPVKKLETIPKLVEKAFKDIEEHVKLDRVHLVELGDSARIYEVAYYVNSQDYKLFRDSHQTLLLNITKLFEKEKIEFAFPSQTIYIAK